MTDKLTVIDFFSGAGGFSEGFRQQGFDVIMGVENWPVAVQTHNLNHNLADKPIDILMYENDIKKIENQLPDTDVIIGSPPCVTFSMSNKAGKADKSLGIRLIEVYLKIVAIKKYKKGSILKAWLMENVPNSRNYVKEFYTFGDLNLGDWASSIGKRGDEIALSVKNNGELLVASDFGSPQSRERFVCGEIVRTGLFPQPERTHNFPPKNPLRPVVTLGQIKSKMPSPVFDGNKRKLVDPNYSSLIIDSDMLTDHFYDTGVYQVEWQMAEYAKINHPFMGRMSFPEDESRPSRTIMATRSASTREAIIYKSELNRKGDGEYRLPTIREASTLMGFPYSYQFIGGESTKWKQIGNAVCPHMSSALAKSILTNLDLPSISIEDIDFSTQVENYRKINDLRNPLPNIFISPPGKMKGSKFRMHPLKSGNMTVELMNYNPRIPKEMGTNGFKWFCNVYLGSGKKYSIVNIDRYIVDKINPLMDNLPEGKEFIEEFYASFSGKIGSAEQLQSLWEKNQNSTDGLLNPYLIVRKIGELVKKYEDTSVFINGLFENLTNKSFIPKRQLLSIWSLGQIVTFISYRPQYRPVYLFELKERKISESANDYMFID